jgi:class 3 adenylate cyclase
MGGFAVVLLFAGVFFTQRNRISKEKKRSDELLLNILPEETAEELKATGSAKAKSFDSVTVLFTDFKNFTQAAEKLSPEELVKEINHCYSEFDRIVTKYRIEKIKTIGDAYMCAGGLPVNNETHLKM